MTVDEQRQHFIIKQSSLDRAIDFFKMNEMKASVNDIIQLTELFSRYIETDIRSVDKYIKKYDEYLDNKINNT